MVRPFGAQTDVSDLKCISRSQTHIHQSLYSRCFPQDIRRRSIWTVGRGCWRRRSPGVIGLSRAVIATLRTRPVPRPTRPCQAGKCRPATVPGVCHPVLWDLQRDGQGPSMLQDPSSNYKDEDVCQRHTICAQSGRPWSDERPVERDVFGET
jgi:hypothetical protein